MKQVQVEWKPVVEKFGWYLIVQIGEERQAKIYIETALKKEEYIGLKRLIENVCEEINK